MIARSPGMEGLMHPSSADIEQIGEGGGEGPEALLIFSFSQCLKLLSEVAVVGFSLHLKLTPWTEIKDRNLLMLSAAQTTRQVRKRCNPFLP